MNISWRLVLYVLIPLGLIFSIVGWRLMSSYEKELEASMTREVEIIGRALQVPVRAAIEERREGQLRLALESVFTIGSVYGAFVYDDAGRLLASAGRGGNDPRYRDYIVDVLEQGEDTGAYARIDGRRVYSAFLPVKSVFGDSIGLIQINRDQREISSAIGGRRVRAVFLALGVVLLSAVIVMTGHYIAHGRAVTQLLHAIDRFEGGQRVTDFSSTGAPEVAKVGNALNKMLMNLSSKETELRERRAVERILRKQALANDQLIALGQLAGGVAHEVGAPLSVILGLAKRLRRRAGEKLSDEEAAWLQQLEAEVRRTESVVRSMLEFSRQKCSFNPTAVKEVVDNAIEAARPELERSGCHVHVDIQQAGSSVAMDPLRMALALRNLISNAAQQAPESEIQVRAKVSERELVISVEDNGSGIAAGQEDKIFEPFFTTRADGHGLGLAFVHKVVMDHMGIVRANNTGHGAEFRIIIPVRQQNTDEKEN